LQSAARIAASILLLQCLRQLQYSSVILIHIFFHKLSSFYFNHKKN